MQTASERLRHELHHALHNLHADIDRVEILAAALDAFSRPVPNYEPRFLRFGAVGRNLDRFELKTDGA